MARQAQEKEMPAYVIFIRERTLNRSELDAYAKAARPTLGGLPIKSVAPTVSQLVQDGPEP
jgi:hypothetical protein